MRYSFTVLLMTAFFLAACGDETTQVNQIVQAGIDIYASEGDLPECTADSDGELAFVKGEPMVRVCVDGGWSATESVIDTVILAGDTVYLQGGKDTIFVAGGKDTVYVKDGNFSCTTQELADSSGIKIVCNGDSIGVVLNGKQGTPGEAGAGCTLKDRTDTTVTVVCGDSTMVIELGYAADDTATISLESVEGYTQKGPFLKGSTVYLYELNGTLGQTNGNFTSVITSDDGRYRFRTRGLKYPYAMVVVDGYYRNEVTGERSDATIRLRAITDVSGRVTGSVNVNLLTHLEYERVNKLATGPGKLKLKEAKQKAQKEILAQFHIDTTKTWNTQSEDMNVFGKSEADAALLAISVMLQGDGSASDLSVLLTEISDDLTDDGEWDSTGSAEARARIADWALNADLSGRLGKFRENVKSWGLSDTVPEFEKIIRGFWKAEYNVGDCGTANEGDTIVIPNEKGSVHSLKCNAGEWQFHRIRDLRDNHVYRVVKIGDLVWMAENLAFEDRIEYDEGLTHHTIMYHRYNRPRDDDSCAKTGIYYTWSAAMDSIAMFSDDGKGCGKGKRCTAFSPVRGICPEGWHLPSHLEWRTLITPAKGKIFNLLEIGYEAWPKATDLLGLSLRPMGQISIYDATETMVMLQDMESIVGYGTTAFYWTVDELDESTAYAVVLNEEIMSTSPDNDKRFGRSVRCVHD